MFSARLSFRLRSQKDESDGRTDGQTDSWTKLFLEKAALFKTQIVKLGRRKNH